MTRFELTCTSDYSDSLLRYVRRIEEAKIPDLTLEYDPFDYEETYYSWDVYVDIGTLDALLKLREAVDINVILLDDNVLEIYDDWRE